MTRPQDMMLFLLSVLAPLGCKDPVLMPVGPAPTTNAPSPISVAGSGATLPATLYQRWARDYELLTVGKTEVHYEPTGSAFGVQSFLTGKTNFGATDNPLIDDEIALAKDDLFEVPATGALVAVAFNVPGVNALQLSRATIAKLFSGKITRWNAAEVVADNPGVVLPDAPVTLVHRMDGSGTTHIFTRYLAEDGAWPKSLGFGRSIQWTAGVGVFGNEGMAVKIKHTEGAIGYVAFGVAQQIKLTMASLQTPTGFVAPSVQSGREALTELAEGGMKNADARVVKGYPLATLSWLLLHRRYEDRKSGGAVLAFVRYGLTEGQGIAEALGYVPLPANLAAKALADVDAALRLNQE